MFTAKAVRRIHHDRSLTETSAGHDRMNRIKGDCFHHIVHHNMIATWLYNKYKDKKAAKEEEKRAAAAAAAASASSAPQNVPSLGQPESEQPGHR